MGLEEEVDRIIATLYDKMYDNEVVMSMLSVRLPRDLDKALPKRDRSAWVIAAIREQLRRDRIKAIAQSAADHADEDLEILAEWEAASAPMPEKPRRARR